MTPSSKTHCCWLLITVGAFVAGLQLERLEPVPVKVLGETWPSSRPLSGPPSSPELGSSANSAEQPAGPKAKAGNGGGEGWSVISSSTKSGSSKDLPPLTERQIEELVLRAIKVANPAERRKAFDRLLQEMQSDSFTVEQAMAIRSAMHENGASSEQWRLFDYAWGANDPEAALAHIDEISERYRRGFTSNMLPGLASVQPQKAIELVSAMEGRERYHMTGRLLEGLADYDAGVATDYVYQLAENGDRTAVPHMKRLTNEVFGTVGFDAGVAWAEQLAAGPLQAAALVRVANRFASQDPLEAAAWAEQFVGAKHNSRLFGEVVREWGDFQAAWEWVESLEPSLAQRDGLSAVYGFRGARQPHEAVQDIIDMPPSEDRNFALNGFISGLAHQDPEAAVLWAAEITEPGMREAAMVRAARHYYRQDTEAAAQWFARSGLPETAWERVKNSR